MNAKKKSTTWRTIGALIVSTPLIASSLLAMYDAQWDIERLRLVVACAAFTGLMVLGYIMFFKSIK